MPNNLSRFPGISMSLSGRRTLTQLHQRIRHLFAKFLPLLLPLSFTVASHAQGTMDFSGATTLMSTFRTFAIYAGAVICFGGLIFAGIRMMSGRFSEAIPGLFGALFGAGVLGWGSGWIGSDSRRNSTDGRGRGIRRASTP